MPGCVKNLLVEVEAVDGDFVLFPLSTGAHLSGFEHRLWLGNLSRCLQRHFLAGASVKHPKEIVVAAGHDSRVGPVPAALELVEDAVVLIEAAQLGAQVLVDGERLDRLRLHVQVPHFHRKIIPRYHVATRVGELDVRDGGDDFREEGSVGRVLGLFEHLRVRVTERGLAHITQPDCSLAGRVDKEIALLGMELRGSDNLCEFLHVGRLDVDDVEGLIGDLHVPQVDA